MAQEAMRLHLSKLAFYEGTSSTCYNSVQMGLDYV